MRALRLSAPRSATIVEIPEPSPEKGEALVAPSYVGLCGTDLELYLGTMPYLTEGSAHYPIQPGHEVAGVVVTSPHDYPPTGTAVLIDPVAGCGRCSACAAGYQTRCRERREVGLRRGMPGGACELMAIPVANLHPLPTGVSPREAVIAEPGVTALNAVERLGEVARHRALVIGAGTVGLIAAQLLMSRGAIVDVVVVEDARIALVEHLGAKPVRQADGETYDAVIEAAGTADAARSAVSAIAAGGTISVVGVQPGPVDKFDLNQIVLKDVTVHGVLNGPGLYGRMLESISARAVDAAVLIEAEFELANAVEALSALTVAGRAAPKIVLRVTSA